MKLDSSICSCIQFVLISEMISVNISYSATLKFIALCKGTRNFTHSCFCTISVSSHTVKKGSCLNAVTKIIVTSACYECLGDSQRTASPTFTIFTELEDVFFRLLINVELSISVISMFNEIQYVLFVDGHTYESNMWWLSGTAWLSLCW